MTDVFKIVADWLQEGSEVAIARIIAMDGFGGRRSGELLAVRNGSFDVTGELALGAANHATIEASKSLLGDPSCNATTITVPVGDVEARDAGLACGGQATILIQRATGIPSSFFDALSAAEEVVLLTDVSTGESLHVNRHGAVGPGAVEPAAPATSHATSAITAAQRMLTKGPAGSALLDGDGQSIWIEAFISAPRLLILGVAVLADAIANQSSLLGWTPTVFSEAQIDEAVALADSFGSVDGVVVLSHDLLASTTLLAAALRGRCGFVGALGSRHTQTARTELLLGAHRLPPEDVGRVHGPVGLDLGSRTPEETALAIVAEMLAVTRSKLSLQSLTRSTGPING
jgi:xanthine dehydrogenase accessory factor